MPVTREVTYFILGVIRILSRRWRNFGVSDCCSMFSILGHGFQKKLISKIKLKSEFFLKLNLACSTKNSDYSKILDSFKKIEHCAVHFITVYDKFSGRYCMICIREWRNLANSMLTFIILSMYCKRIFSRQC